MILITLAQYIYLICFDYLGQLCHWSIFSNINTGVGDKYHTGTSNPYVFGEVYNTMFSGEDFQTTPQPDCAPQGTPEPLIDRNQDKKPLAP